jgi:hypothetical protein
LATKVPSPGKQGGTTIQRPLLNTFNTIWEYKESFQHRQIDFATAIGISCPICGKADCYRPITPYWRYAIELFPEYRVEHIPVARFICRNEKTTFSLLPIQMIPYFQYTAHTIISVLFLALQIRESGQRGFHGAAMGVDPDSGITAWLVTYWFMAISRGFRGAHAKLTQWYDLSEIHSEPGADMCKEVSAYISAVEWKQKVLLWAGMVLGFTRYSGVTQLFLFGIPSQCRGRASPFLKTRPKEAPS